MDDRDATLARIESVFSDVGKDGCLQVIDVDGDAEISLRPDQVCASASTGKVPILVALMRAVAAGELSLEEQIEVPVNGRTDGPSGLSAMRYPARLALGDLAHLMIAISDNHATDLVLQRVPPRLVNAAMRELGLAVTTFDATIHEFFAAFAAHETFPEIDLRAEVAAWRTTPAEMCRLLRAIWRNEAAPEAQCEQMRAILRCCLTSNGLEASLPVAAQARNARKTGTLLLVDGEDPTGPNLVVRNEVGVVEYPDGRRYAVAVFTRVENGDLKLRDLASEQAVGTAVRLALDHLRLLPTAGT